jgi:hypothetical protein
MEWIEINRRLAVLSARLNEAPASIVAGEIAAPLEGDAPELGRWPELVALLSAANGARLGSVDLWSSDEIAGKQYVLEGTALQPGEWVVFGQLLYEPLCVNAEGDVILVPAGQAPEELGSLSSTVGSLLSSAYYRLVEDGEKDEWFELLREVGLADL